MKVIIIKEINEVRSVELAERYLKKHTEQDLINRIEQLNNASDGYHYAMHEVSNDVYEAFKFLLGDSKYRGTWTIHDLVVSLTDLKGELEGLSRNVDYLLEPIEKKLDEVNEYIGSLKE